MATEKTIPFSTRMKPAIKKALIAYCDKEGIIVQRFIEDAVLNELSVRRTGKE